MAEKIPALNDLRVEMLKQPLLPAAAVTSSVTFSVTATLILQPSEVLCHTFAIYFCTIELAVAAVYLELDSAAQQSLRQVRPRPLLVTLPSCSKSS